MKIKFLAKSESPSDYMVDGSNINGIEASAFTEGSLFTGSLETQSAGIYNMQWISGEVHVTLGQMTKAYQVASASHDWRESDWIDAADYDPTVCYVKATNAQVAAMIARGEAEYWQDPADGKWTVRPVEQEEPV